MRTKFGRMITGALSLVAAGAWTARAGVGDFAVFNNMGDDSLKPTCETGAVSTVLNRYTNTVVEPLGSYALEPAGDGVRLAAGRHLALFNVRVDKVSGPQFRAEMQAWLSLEQPGVTNALAYGRAQGFIRNADGAEEAVLAGGAVVEAAEGDILRLWTARSDLREDVVVQVEPGHTALQLLKLDDSLDCLRARRASNSGNVGSATFADVTWDTVDESSAGSIAYTAGSGDITLVSNGYYLVFANTHLKRTDSLEFSGTPSIATRMGATQRLTLNGAPLVGSYTTTYLRGNQDSEQTDDGTLVIGMLVKAAAGDVLSVEHQREHTPTTYRIIGGKTGVAVVRLPDSAAVARLEDTLGQDLNQGTSGGDASPPVPVLFRAQAEPPAAVFVHDTNGVASQIAVQAYSRYLFLGAYFDDDDGNLRQVPNPQWSVNGATLPYGETSQYSRNDLVHNNGNWSGMLAELTTNDVVAMTSRRLGNSGTVSGDSVGLQAVDLLSLSGAPVLMKNRAMAITTNATRVISSGYLLALDRDTPAASLTYTLTRAPTDALVYLDGAPLGASDTFTQGDVDAGKLTLSALDTLGAFEVFDFSVSDGASTPATGTFRILTSVGVFSLPDAGATDEDTVLTNLTGGAVSVLANDAGDGLHILACDTVSLHGATIQMAADGTFSYDPRAAETLQRLQAGDAPLADTFTYVVEDAVGLTKVENVTITVGGTNDTFAAVNDYIEDAALTETGAASLAVSLVANDGIVSQANGATNVTLLLNYTAESRGPASRWQNLGSYAQPGLLMFAEDGVLLRPVSSVFPGIRRAYVFSDITLAKLYYGTSTANDSISKIITDGVDLRSASLEFWVRAGAKDATQISTVFETGGATGTGIVLDHGVLKAANGLGTAQIDYDLALDPLGALAGPWTNEFFHLVLTLDFENDRNALYVNGVCVGTAANPTTDWCGGDGTGLGHFGGTNHGGFMNSTAGTAYDTYFNGAIAAFRLYAGALTPAEVRQNFDALATGGEDLDSTVTVSGLYDAGGTLVPGTGTPVALPSGATVTLDTATGAFTFDPAGIPGIADLWPGATFVDRFRYQATDGDGHSSDATVEVVIRGVSQQADATVTATEGRSATLAPSALLGRDQLDHRALDPFLAFYVTPDLLKKSATAYGRWTNAGNGGDVFDASVNHGTLVPVDSGFAGLPWALTAARVSFNSLSFISAGDMTVEVWFKPDQTSGGRQMLFEAGGSGNGFGIFYDPVRNTVQAYFDGGTDSDPDVQLFGEVSGVRWDAFNQVTVLADIRNASGGDSLTLYLNNDPTAAFSTARSSAATNAAGAVSFFCGNDNGGVGAVQGTTALTLGSVPFTGGIGHVRVYDRILSPAELAQAYDAVRRPLTSVQAGATALGATLSLDASGQAVYDASALTTNLDYQATAADGFTFAFTDSDGSTVNRSAGVTVTGTGTPLARDDTLVIGAGTLSTNFNPLANDSGLGLGAVIVSNVVVADYRDDFAAGVSNAAPADFRDGSGFGWHYVWNAPTNWVNGTNFFDGASGALTETNAYRLLMWDQSLGYYCVNADGVSTSGAPGMWVRLNGTGGHPGPGTQDNDGDSNVLGRYPIAAYTVAEPGYYGIADSLVRKNSTANDGLDVAVLVNGEPRLARDVVAATDTPFDVELGLLAAGDTIYVAVGAYLTRGSDGFALDYTIVRLPDADATVPTGTGSLTTDGATLTYTPGSAYDDLGVGQSAFETFTYTVEENGELTTAQVTIQIVGVNDAPVGVADPVATDEDAAAVVGNVLANDTDVDRGDVLGLSVSEVQGEAGIVGTVTASALGAQVTVFADGSFVYDSTNRFNGLSLYETATDTFTYRVRDALGLAAAAPATVTVTVAGRDDGVSATPNAYTLDADQTVSGNLIADDTGDGADASLDLNDTLTVLAVNTNGLLGELTIVTARPICFQGTLITLGGAPQTVTYDAAGGTFVNPVVFANPASNKEREPGSVRISNINPAAGTFQLEFKEQPETRGTFDGDGSAHAAETVSWMVFEAGQYQLPDGRRLEVGTAALSAKQQDGGPATWQTVAFGTPFGVQPVVLNQLQTWNDPDGELFGTRLNGGDYATGGVTTNEFQVALEDYEGDTANSPQTETLGWLAIEPGLGTWGGARYQAGVTAKTVTEATNVVSSFAAALGSGQPAVIGSLATFAGVDPATLRFAQGTRKPTGINFYVSEDTLNDSETGHSAEQVAFLALGSTNPVLYGYDRGSAGAFTYDPAGKVNATFNNPVVETFTYTLADEHGNTDTATVTLTVLTPYKGTLLLLR